MSVDSAERAENRVSGAWSGMPWSGAECGISAAVSLLTPNIKDNRSLLTLCWFSDIFDIFAFCILLLQKSLALLARGHYWLLTSDQRWTERKWSGAGRKTGWATERERTSGERTFQKTIERSVERELRDAAEGRAGCHKNILERLAANRPLSAPLICLLKVASLKFDTGCWKSSILTSLRYQQEAQLMLTTGSTRLAVSRGQQTWYHSTCYI